MDIEIEKCLLTHKRKNASGKNHYVRTQYAIGIIPQNEVCNPSLVLKSTSLINDQVIGKILYTIMSMSSRRIALNGD